MFPFVMHRLPYIGAESAYLCFFVMRRVWVPFLCVLEGYPPAPWSRSKEGVGLGVIRLCKILPKIEVSKILPIFCLKVLSIINRSHALELPSELTKLPHHASVP